MAFNEKFCATVIRKFKAKAGSKADEEYPGS